MRLVVVAALSLMATLVACGGDKSPRESDIPAARTAAPDDEPSSLATPPAGWERFALGGYALWLPEAFEGGELGTGPERIIELIRSLGPACAASADFIANAQSLLKLILVDSTQCDREEFVTNVNAASEIVPDGVAPRDYMEGLINFLPRAIEVVEKDVVTIGGRSAVRIGTSATLGALTSNRCCSRCPSTARTGSSPTRRQPMSSRIGLPSSNAAS